MSLKDVTSDELSRAVNMVRFNKNLDSKRNLAKQIYKEPFLLNFIGEFVEHGCDPVIIAATLECGIEIGYALRNDPECFKTLQKSSILSD